MRTCSGHDLVKAIAFDPSWARGLKEDLEVTTFVDLSRSKITHLSPHLIFCGKNREGLVATFDYCSGLQVPLGKYHGGVSFKSSGITHIPNDKSLFNILGKTRNGLCASFEGCKNLLEATGEYEGAVDFSESGVAEIWDLTIKGRWESYKGLRGFSASFFSCLNLKQARGNYQSAVDFTASGVESIDPQELVIHQPNELDLAILLVACQGFRKLEGKFPGMVNLDNSSVSCVGRTSISNTKSGIKLSARQCPNLLSLPKDFTPKNTLCDPKLLSYLHARESILESLQKEKEVDILCQDP